MIGVKLFKKFLMPCGICAAIPVVKPTNSNIDNEKKLIRPSELPIYKFEPTGNPPQSDREPPCVPKPGVVEQSFGTVRKTVQDFLKQLSGYTDVIKNTIETGKAHSQVSIDYLREETNVLPRIGAIGVGGLSGLILGLRGGKFKKFVYSSTGALVVASICYPKQAQEGMTAATYYVNIGYNFLRGVKPGDEQLEIHWPAVLKLPTNLSDIKEVAVSVADTAGSAAGTLISKCISSFNDFAETPKPGKERPKHD